MTFQAWKHMWHMWIIRWSAGPATDAWVPSDDNGVCGISGTFPLQPMAFERGAFHVAPEGRSIHLQRHWNTSTWTTDPTGSPNPPPLIYSASEPLSVPIAQTPLSVPIGQTLLSVPIGQTHAEIKTNERAQKVIDA